MLPKLAFTAAVALATSSLTAAQTFSACNPLQKSGCPADPAVGSTQTIDFTKGENKFFTAAAGTSVTYDPALGATFTISKENEGPTFTSVGYIFFGRVDVVVRAASGVGVVTSVVLQSDDLDEIDWEWLGGDTTQVQSNYFSKGDTSTYDRGGFSPVSNPQAEFHTYSIDWTKDKLDWIIDGKVVRTLKYADAKGGAGYPQSPMQIKLGTWIAGRKDAAPGTIQWAGGLTDFSKAPFIAYYQKVTVQDYMNGASSAGSYVYGDQTGTYQSIKIQPGGGSQIGGGAQSPSSGQLTPAAASSPATQTPVSPPKTAPSPASFFPSVPHDNAVATGTPSFPSSDNRTSSGGQSGVRPGSSGPTSPSSPNTSPITASSSKLGVNMAFLGAALFALVSL